MVGPGNPPAGASRALEVEKDMLTHWEQAVKLDDPRKETVFLEPGLKTAFLLQEKHRSDLDTLRARVCHDVQQMKLVRQQEISEWWDSLRPHVQDLYQDQTRCVQVVLLKRPLWFDAVARPGTLERTLRRLPTVGADQSWQRLAKGDRWQVRQPMNMQDFHKENLKYIEEKLQRHKTDPHWQTLLAEIAADVAQKRVTGPYEGPPEWPKKTVAAPEFEHCKELLRGATVHEATSVAFAILQTGSDGKQKVRGGEDWRRGLHNSTVAVGNGPANRRADAFLAEAACIASSGHTPVLWGTDQQDVYRQLPIKDPADTLYWRGANFVETQRAPLRIDLFCLVLWQDSRPPVLVSPVFPARGRHALCRRLRGIGGHGLCSIILWIHPQDVGRAGFLLQDLEATTTSAVAPHPRDPDDSDSRQLHTGARPTKDAENLHLDRRDPPGREHILSETLIGQAVKSCLMPLYRMAHYHTQAKLSEGLRDSLTTLRYLLGQLQPKVFSVFRFDHKTPAVIFADAYTSSQATRRYGCQRRSQVTSTQMLQISTRMAGDSWPSCQTGRQFTLQAKFQQRWYRNWPPIEHSSTGWRFWARW